MIRTFKPQLKLIRNRQNMHPITYSISNKNLKKKKRKKKQNNVSP